MIRLRGTKIGCEIKEYRNVSAAEPRTS